MIKLFADYHTHTIYSHGKGTIMDNVIAAKNKGLTEIAITDHGIRHLQYAVKRKNIAKMRKEIDIINEKNDSIKVLLGMECNIISLDGDVDIDEDIMKQLDILLVGYHLMVNTKSFSDSWGIYGKNYLNKFFGLYKDELKEKNTDALIKAVRKYKIDIITHPGARIPINTLKLAKEAAKTGTALEINCPSGFLNTEQVIAAAREGVKFVIDSDAHKPSDVGNFDRGIKVAMDAGLRSDQIINAIK